jgi:hypothetical protein
LHVRSPACQIAVGVNDQMGRRHGFYVNGCDYAYDQNPTLTPIVSWSALGVSPKALS